MPVDLKYEDLKLSYGAGNILQVGRSAIGHARSYVRRASEAYSNGTYESNLA